MQLSAEDTYDVAGKVLEIPLEAIRPAPDNVRSDLGDLDGLAASINEVGVLQPIIVIPDGDGSADTFMVLVGHRRLAAAQLAGLMTIPAIARTRPEDAKRVKAMLIENVQRHELSAIDEARTFERLEVEFGVTQQDIAAQVGCSQAHVSKRLSLLALPSKARKMVTDGELGIGAAVELAKLADHPDRLKVALKRMTEQNWDPDQAVGHELQEVEELEQLAAEVLKAEAAGLKVLWTQLGHGMNYEQSKKRERALAGAARIVKADDYAPADALKLDKPAQHAKEPCHALALTASATKVEKVAYCTDRKRHAPKGASDLKAAKASATERRKISPEEEAANRKRAERLAHRRSFVEELVRHRKLAKGEIATLALSQVALDGWGEQHKKTARLLGLDLTGRDATQALKDFIGHGHEDLLRCALASMLTEADSVHVPRHVEELLETLGYEPTEDEQADRAVRDAYRAADEAFQRLLDHFDTLDLDEPDDVGVARDALDDDDLTVERAQELQALFEAKLADLPAGDENTEASARAARERLLERAEELDDGPEGMLERIGELTAELDEGVSIARGAEITRVFDAMFVELNDLQTGDVVETNDAGDGHTIERATSVVSADALDGGGCPFPLCTLEDLHDGNHRIKLKPFAKAPKDCSQAEHMSQMLIGTLLDQQPDNEELRGLYEELVAGVDDARATEVHERLLELMEPAKLTRYAKRPVGPTETNCRALIAELPADDPRVIALQQELYAGVPTGLASSIRKKLKAIKAELAKAGAPA